MEAKRSHKGELHLQWIYSTVVTVENNRCIFNRLELLHIKNI